GHLVPSPCCSCFWCYLHPRALLSFPTRRSSDLFVEVGVHPRMTSSHQHRLGPLGNRMARAEVHRNHVHRTQIHLAAIGDLLEVLDRKSTRLNSSHVKISYAVFCLKKKNKKTKQH